MTPQSPIKILPDLMASMLEHDLKAEDVKLAACISSIAPCKFAGVHRGWPKGGTIRLGLIHPVNLVNIVNQRVRYKTDIIIYNSNKHVDIAGCNRGIRAFSMHLATERDNAGKYGHHLGNMKMFYTTQEHLDAVYAGDDNRLRHTTNYERLFVEQRLTGDMTFSVTQWVANTCRLIENTRLRKITLL